MDQYKIEGAIQFGTMTAKLRYYQDKTLEEMREIFEELWTDFQEATDYHYFTEYLEAFVKINNLEARLASERKEIAIAILDQFENLLDECNIKIPDEFREGNEDEACLYGENYYMLEDAIIRIIQND